MGSFDFNKSKSIQLNKYTTLTEVTKDGQESSKGRKFRQGSNSKEAVGNHETNEALRRPRSRCWTKTSLPSRMHQTVVGLPEEKQPSRCREQTILYSRQEDGENLWNRENPRLRNGQIFDIPFD